MRTRFRSEADGWNSKGSKITSERNLDTIRTILDKEGPVLVQHWFYRGGSAPEYRIFDDYDEFMEFLSKETYAGDAIDIWSIWEICQPDGRRAEGKCPDDAGLIPKGGAY
jgi:hypothetical protein